MKECRYKIINAKTGETIIACNDYREAYLIAKHYVQCDKINTAILDSCTGKIVTSCTKSQGLS